MTRSRLNRGGNRLHNRPVAHRVHPHELGPTHPRLRPAPHPRRTPQARDHAAYLPSASSPASTDTSPACSATRSRAGLIREMHDADGCLDNDLSARPSNRLPATPLGLIRARPRTSSWPITGLPAPSPNCPLTTIRASTWRAARRSPLSFGGVVPGRSRQIPGSSRHVGWVLSEGCDVYPGTSQSTI